MNQPGPLPDSHGLLRVFIGTDPAAGFGISQPITTNTRHRIISIQATLVTDANVANRFTYFEVISGSVNFRIYANLTQTASQTIIYNFIAGGPDRSAAINGQLNVQIPLSLWLNDAFAIQISADNLQATDNWGPPEIFVEEWIEE